MINNLTEAIQHCNEVIEEKRKIMSSNAYSNVVRDNCKDCISDHEQLAEWLTELKERREADRWIPVSERLPEKDGRFIICTPSGDVDTNCFMFGQFTRPYVIAWRHLPEPYKEREEN